MSGLGYEPAGVVAIHIGFEDVWAFERRWARAEISRSRIERKTDPLIDFTAATELSVRDDYFVHSQARCGPRARCGVFGPEAVDMDCLGQREIDVVPSIEELDLADGINREGRNPVSSGDGLGEKIDPNLAVPGEGLRGQERLDVRFGDRRRQKAVLHRVRCKNITEARRRDASNPEISQSIDRRLARRAAAKVAPRDQQRGSGATRLVERIVARRAVRVVAEVMQQKGSVALRARALEEARGDKLISVDIGLRQRDRLRLQRGEPLHFVPPQARPASRSRASVNLPVTAAAGAIDGDIRWVREPGPCRPLKLRLVVEAQRSPAGTESPFIATHIEQPESTHSRPASAKIRESPSSS